ncbi:MAG: hypothetical protein KTR31_14720 [Myxococcales bacterium]|nr:hypothetical protein [Myxococcales bacterium]
MKLAVVAVMALAGCAHTRSFEAAHDKLEERYAFTEWKAIDWDAHLAEYLPLVTDAKEQGDQPLFGQIIRRYGHSIPDAHIEVEGAAPCDVAAGGYGVVLSRLDDGTVAVVAVSGSTDVAPGDRVLEWNGVPIDQALAEAPVWCGDTGLATPEQRAFEQSRWLVRGVPGETVTVTLQDETAREVDLVATEDDGWSFAVTGPRKRGRAAVNSTMLAGSTVGYIHIAHVGHDGIGNRVADALASLIDAGADRLVLDLRDNDGGSDQLAADIAGHFHATRRFYETATYWDSGAGRDTHDEEIWVEPQSPQWTQPVAVLVNHFTVSSGEGIAMAVGWSPHATIIGFEPTAASFGMTGGRTRVGEGIVIWFPLGRSLDDSDAVQLDSDHNGEGGVHPTIRVPWTLENRVDWASEGDPELDVAFAHLLAGGASPR